jgi:hypothetical protein
MMRDSETSDVLPGNKVRRIARCSITSSARPSSDNGTAVGYSPTEISIRIICPRVD